MTLQEQLRLMPDIEVLKSANRAVQNERESTSRVLHHFHEVNRRRLYTKYNCSSLREWAIKIQKYPEDQADRRIAATRLMAEIPEIEQKIEQGELNLTQASMVNAFFHQQAKAGKPYSTEAKKRLLEEVKNTSTRQTAAKLADKAPNTKPIKERAKPLGNGRIDFRCELSQATLDKLNKLKRKHAHKKFTTNELINFLCDEALEDKPEPKNPRPDSKATIIREVKKRDQNQCTSCGSDYALEIDHILPKSMGGKDTPDNLRVLCRACNQRAAIEKLGQEKMDPHINRGAAGRSVERASY